MKNKEIKKFSVDEINKKINSFKKDLFNSRFKKVNGQLDDTAKISQNKRNVAKLLTELNIKRKKWAKKYY
mgnify:CR=1 FL=1